MHATLILYSRFPDGSNLVLKEGKTNILSGDIANIVNCYIVILLGEGGCYIYVLSFPPPPGGGGGLVALYNTGREINSRLLSDQSILFDDFLKA